MCGNHIGGKEIIEFLLKNGVKFKYFVTIDKQTAIKNKVSGFYDYTAMAAKNNIPVYYCERFDLKSEKDIDFFKKNGFDLLVQGGWQRLFPQEVLDSLKIGALGTHGGADFLPKYRGRSPLNWSLIENKKRFIMQLFLMKSGADDGDIIDWFKFDINVFDDINTLYKKYAISIKYMILRNINDLKNKNASFKRQNGIPLYYPKRTNKDGQIDWENMYIDDIYNLVRATSEPYPCAYSFIDEKIIKFIKVRVFDTSLLYLNASYGEIVEIFSDDTLLINCLGGVLLIEKYKYDSDLRLGDKAIFSEV